MQERDWTFKSTGVTFPCPSREVMTLGVFFCNSSVSINGNLVTGWDSINKKLILTLSKHEAFSHPD